MPKPSFATPLPQSSRSEILEWRFPPPHQQYVLTGRSRAAWHTSFVIPQLNLLLDAGLCVNRLRPKHVFLTHGHNDHVLLAPAFVKREDPPDVFCPAEMAPAFDAFIRANSLLNLGGLVGADDIDDAEDDGEGGVGGVLRTHVTHGLRPGDEVPLRRLKQAVSARAFACDHSVPCLGYVFSTTTQRLRPEFAGVAAAELAALRRSGEVVTAARETPLFAFLGDTTAETLRAAPAWLEAGVPVVVTECSFLYEEHRGQAERTKHTLWAELEGVVRRWPRTVFVLMHFSLRYSDEEVRSFFKQMADPPGNIVVWVDGEDESTGG